MTANDNVWGCRNFFFFTVRETESERRRNTIADARLSHAIYPDNVKLQFMPQILLAENFGYISVQLHFLCANAWELKFRSHICLMKFKTDVSDTQHRTRKTRKHEQLAMILKWSSAHDQPARLKQMSTTKVIMCERNTSQHVNDTRHFRQNSGTISCGLTISRILTKLRTSISVS